MGLLAKLRRWMRGRKADDFIPQDPGERRTLLIGTRFDYAAATRGGLDSNVVMAPIQWIMRTFPEARLIIERRSAGQWRRADEHELERRLRRPNAYHDGITLLMGTVLSYFVSGNAYWLKARGRLGNLVELWYVPHWLIEPRWPRDGSRYISHYEYRPEMGRRLELPVADVVHLRFGLDPRNPRLGLSPLRALLREVYTDDEAANFSAAILKNMGVPGVVLSPKDASVAVSAEDIERLKEDLTKKWSGDHRGEPLVMGAPTEVKQFGFDPNQLMLGNIRDIAEERVCAALGLPAAVVGFGAGLQQTKVGATMRELRKLAWLQCIIPTQLAMAEQLSAQLLPDYEAMPEQFRVRFDSSRISAFQEEQTEQARRVRMLTDGGILRLDQAQEQLGLEPDPARALYLQPINLQAVDSDGNAMAGPGELATETEKALERIDQLAIDLAATERRLSDSIKAQSPTIHFTPQIDVHPAAISVTPQIEVQPAAVTVTPPSIVVEPAQITVPAPEITLHAHLPVPPQGRQEVTVRKVGDGFVVTKTAAGGDGDGRRS